MSILASSQQIEITTPVYAVLLFLAWLTAAPIIAWAVGVFRRGSIRGPVRMGGDMPITALLLTTFFAGALWIGLQVAYITNRSIEYQHEHPDGRFDLTQLAASDYAFVSTVPFGVGLLILLVGDALPRRAQARRIGYSLEKFLPGVAKGIVAMLIVLPVMWAASMALQGFYDLIHFEHPSEHDLLAAMKGAPMLVRVCLVFGACVAAPVFEETLFRGHVQTLLVRLFTPSPVARPLPPLALVVDDASEALPIPAPLEHPLPELDPVEPPPGLRWVAVFITALVFAVFHPMWMAPLIFVLAVCLGYAYERTGNLWVAIVMHAIFNASSTVMVLNFT